MRKIETEQYIKLYKKAFGTKRRSGSGTIIISIVSSTEDGGWYDIENDRPIPSPLSEIISKISPSESAEMEIEFSASGHSSPASMYGGSDNLGWEGEDEEERTIDAVNIYNDGQQVGRLPEDTFSMVEAMYTQEINEEDIDYAEPEDDYDPREDYDDEYDPRRVI